MTARRPAGRPFDARMHPRHVRASRRLITEWAEEELADARERLAAKKPERAPPSRRATHGFYLRIAIVLAVAVLLALVLRAGAHDAIEPVQPRDVYVIDGDTIRFHGQSYRLIGFDAPEVGQTAECEKEIERGYDAKARVVDLVWSDRPLTLESVACSCAPGTQGTMLCNYGRRCGTLRVSGEDVGAILMREGLAKPYPYRWPHPPPKPRWCGRS